jgi:hypothetical protein
MDDANASAGSGTTLEESGRGQPDLFVEPAPKPEQKGMKF